MLHILHWNSVDLLYIKTFSTSKEHLASRSAMSSCSLCLLALLCKPLCDIFKQLLIWYAFNFRCYSMGKYVKAPEELIWGWGREIEDRLFSRHWCERTVQYISPKSEISKVSVWACWVWPSQRLNELPEGHVRFVSCRALVQAMLYNFK